MEKNIVEICEILRINAVWFGSVGWKNQRVSLFKLLSS